MRSTQRRQLPAQNLAAAVLHRPMSDPFLGLPSGGRWSSMSLESLSLSLHPQWTSAAESSPAALPEAAGSHPAAGDLQRQDAVRNEWLFTLCLSLTDANESEHEV